MKYLGWIDLDKPIAGQRPLAEKPRHDDFCMECNAPATPDCQYH